MILVTVGTTMPFDELLVEVDRLADLMLLTEDIVCQTGQSGYQMKHGIQFRGRPSIDDLIAQSTLVVTHGGATVIQLLLRQKPFVAFPNPRGADDHQTTFLAQVAEIANISWSRDVRMLEALIRQRQELGAAVLRSDIPHAADSIRSLVFSED